MKKSVGHQYFIYLVIDFYILVLAYITKFIISLGVIGILWSFLFWILNSESPTDHRCISTDEIHYILKTTNKNVNNKVCYILILKIFFAITKNTNYNKAIKNALESYIYI